MLLLCSFFFFSSRRRHTSWPRDWSSDVCSSDLVKAVEAFLGIFGAIQLRWHGSHQLAVGVFKHSDFNLSADKFCFDNDLVVALGGFGDSGVELIPGDRESTRLNSSHVANSYAVFCLKK